MRHESTGPGAGQPAPLPKAVTGFAAARTRRRRTGIVLIVAGLVTAIDFFSPVPVPLIGMPAIVIGAALAALGYLLHRGAARMPVAEALLLAEARGGRLTKALLVMELRLEPAEAGELLHLMEREGLAEAELAGTEDLKLDLPAIDPVYRIKGLPEAAALPE